MSNTAKKIIEREDLKFADLPASFDVALSFAGEDRQYVLRVRKALEGANVSVFYDGDYQIELWGKYLTEILPDVYCNRAKVVVIFVSAAYARKEWTRLEKRAALERALKEKNEYVLPARIDRTELPGLSSVVHYLDLNNLSPEDFANNILKKIGKLPSSSQFSGNIQDKVDPTASLLTHINQKDNLDRYLIAEGTEDAHKEISTLFNLVAQKVSELKAKATHLNLDLGGTQRHLVVRRSGRGAVTVEIQWQQTYRNKFDDAQLLVAGWKGLRLIPGRAEAIFDSPLSGPAQRMNYSLWALQCQAPGVWIWVGSDKKTTLTTQDLASKIYEDFLELIKAHHAE